MLIGMLNNDNYAQSHYSTSEERENKGLSDGS